MFVIAKSTLLHEIVDESPNIVEILASLTDMKFRRIDRYTLLCLAGALKCAQTVTEMPRNTSMVLTTGSGTVSTSIKTMDSIVVKKNPPKPFHFVNSLGNSACYLLAKAFNLDGASIALSQERFSFEAAITQVYLNFISDDGETSLIGGVDEAPTPITDQLKRLSIQGNYTSCYEGSHWLYLTKNKPEHSSTQIHKPEYFQGKHEVIQHLERNNIRQTFLNYSPSSELHEQYSNSSIQMIYPKNECCPHGSYSGHNYILAIDFLESHPNENKVAVIAKDMRSTDTQSANFCVTMLSRSE